jgi:CheY-like chemotaxis protein
MMIYYVEKNADVWSRVEPLLAELLDGTKSGPPAPKSEPPGSPRRDKPAGSPSFITAAPKVQPAAQPASDTLLDAVFTMLGSDAACDEQRDSHDRQFASAPEVEDEPPWVLSIDDDADFSDALKCRLEACGVAVVRAFSGMEGYRLAFTSPASAILLDYNMPNGQGDYILGRLSDNPVTKNIPVIVITGVRDKSLERKMYNLGAKRFLTKPVAFDTLRDELAKYIEILAVPAM